MKYSAVQTVYWLFVVLYQLMAYLLPNYKTHWTEVYMYFPTHPLQCV